MKNIGFLLVMGLPFVSFITLIPLIILGMVGLVDPGCITWGIRITAGAWIVGWLMFLIPGGGR